MTKNLKFLAICGSLRERSYNAALLRAVESLLPAYVEMMTFNIAPIPAYNRDVEVAGLPESVTALIMQIRAADAMLIATPEYNHSIPGVLKNALDWASRGQNGQPSALNGKPLGVMSVVTGRFGGVRAQEHMIQIAAGVNMRQMMRPSVIIPQAAKVFDENLKLVDASTIELVRNFVTALADWTTAHKNS